MTIEYIEGFDRANTYASLVLRGWFGTNTAWVAVTGRNSQGSALRKTAGGEAFLDRVLPGGAKASRVIGVAVRVNGLTSGYRLVSLVDGANEQLILATSGTGALEVKRGSTTLGTSAIIWSNPTGLGVWKYVEFVTTIHNSTGSYAVYVDGVSVLSGSGIDTQDTANASANTLRIGFNGASLTDLDDMYVGDTRLGERRVVSLDMTSDSAVAWTRSTGATNYGTIDDNPLDATDYNEATAASLRDQFGMANLSYTPQSIDAVAVNYVHNKQDSGARTIRAGIVSGGSTGNGATVSPLLTTNAFQQDIFATDPNTGVAWSKAGVDAAEPFYETVT